jgi:hypothetical protein
MVARLYRLSRTPKSLPGCGGYVLILEVSMTTPDPQNRNAESRTDPTDACETDTDQPPCHEPWVQGLHLALHPYVGDACEQFFLLCRNLAAVARERRKQRKRATESEGTSATSDLDAPADQVG